MEHINAAAEACVLRASAFAGIAVVVTMVSLSFDLELCFRFGAGLSVGWAVFLVGWAVRLPHTPLRDNQVWIMLAPEHRPPKDQARNLIVPPTQTLLYEYAQKTAGVAVLLAILSLASGL
jgi:hypothetical protein